MIWIIFRNFKNNIKERNVSLKKIWKDSKMFSKIFSIFIGLAILGFSLFYNPYKLSGVFQLILVLIGAVIYILGIYFGSKHIYEKYDITKFYKNKINKLEDILLDNYVNPNSKEEMNYLVDQINENINKLKIADEIIKPAKLFASSVLLPLLVWFGKNINVDNNEIIDIFSSFILIAMMIFAIYYILSAFQDTINSDYKKMEYLKMMLNDMIYLKFKEESKEIKAKDKNDSLETMNKIESITKEYIKNIEKLKAEL